MRDDIEQKTQRRGWTETREREKERAQQTEAAVEMRDGRSSSLVRRRVPRTGAG